MPSPMIIHNGMIPMLMAFEIIGMMTHGIFLEHNGVLVNGCSIQPHQMLVLSSQEVQIKIATDARITMLMVGQMVMKIGQ